MARRSACSAGRPRKYRGGWESANTRIYVVSVSLSLGDSLSSTSSQHVSANLPAIIDCIILVHAILCNLFTYVTNYLRNLFSNLKWLQSLHCPFKINLLFHLSFMFINHMMSHNLITVTKQHTICVMLVIHGGKLSWLQIFL